jgi:hypothetical protein
MVAQMVRSSPPFMEPEGLVLLCSEEPVIGRAQNQLNVTSLTLGS